MQAKGAVLDATVWPMERAPWDGDATHEAMGWLDGKIQVVGSNQEVEAWAREHHVTPIRKPGCIVHPAFFDAHMHFLHVGVVRIRPDLSTARSAKEILSILHEYVQQHPGTDAIIGEGWDEQAWEDDTPLTGQDLDAITTDRPLVARRVCGHISVGNQAAADLARTKWPKMVRDDGWFIEEPSIHLNDVLPLSVAQWREALKEAQAVAFQEGVLGIGEYCQWDAYRAYEEAAEAGELHVRLSASMYWKNAKEAHASGFRTGRRRGKLQDAGCKVFLDGSLGGHTAWLREPYSDAGGTGLQLYSREELQEIFHTLDGMDLQIHAHAIGDAAIGAALETYETLPGKQRDWSHRIEHYELPSAEDLEATKRLRIWACMQPNFVGVWSAPGGMYEERLGERYRANNPFRTCMEQQVPICFGSDGMPFGPLRGVQSAMEHTEASERLSDREATWFYTVPAAESCGWEPDRIQAGKPANFVVRDGLDLHATYADGTCVWSAS